MFFIRQGATHKVALGPFVDVGDGFTPETGVTLGAADEAEVILHDNGTVIDISGYTWAAIATADGYYHLTLQSGISNTVGHMTVIVQDDSVFRPVKAEFTVVEESVYDNLYAAAAVGPLSAAAVNAECDRALVTTTYAEPSSVPTATASIKDMLRWLFTLARNKGMQTSTTKTLRNDADDADIATSAISDDATTFIRNKWS